MSQCIFLDLLFEWLYKNEGLKALSEAGYFDNVLVAGQYDLEDVENIEIDYSNDENEDMEDDCFDAIISEV